MDLVVTILTIFLLIALGTIVFLINDAKKKSDSSVLSEQLEEKISERKQHLDTKKGELEAILKETQKEEDILVEKSKEFENLIEAHLLKAYKRIRENVKNGLAIVPIERGASGGSFFTIPPQVQLEIASRNKIITDEHSGRILVDAVLAEEESEKIQALIQA